jgi:hypothetical protein
MPSDSSDLGVSAERITTAPRNHPRVFYGSFVLWPSLINSAPAIRFRAARVSWKSHVSNAFSRT